MAHLKPSGGSQYAGLGEEGGKVNKTANPNSGSSRNGIKKK